MHKKPLLIIFLLKTCLVSCTSVSDLTESDITPKRKYINIQDEIILLTKNELVAQKKLNELKNKKSTYSSSQSAALLAEEEAKLRRLKSTIESKKKELERSEEKHIEIYTSDTDETDMVSPTPTINTSNEKLETLLKSVGYSHVYDMGAIHKEPDYQAIELDPISMYTEDPFSNLYSIEYVPPLE